MFKGIIIINQCLLKILHDFKFFYRYDKLLKYQKNPYMEK